MYIIKLIISLVLAFIILYFIDSIVTYIFFDELKTLEHKSNVFKTISEDYSTKIIEGIMPLNSTEVFVTTTEEDDLNYLNIPKSIYRNNGIEFSFSFWLNKGTTINKNLANKILLLYGLKNKETLVTKLPNNIDTNILITDISPIDKQFITILEQKKKEPIQYPSIDPNNKNYREFKIDTNNDIIVKCPLIKFGENGNSIDIELNTNNKIHNKFSINSDALKLLSGDYWNLLTFTFQDYKNIAGFASGIKIIFYINDKQISTQIIKNDSLKINNGNIYILPNTKKITNPNINASIADVMYHNRALKINEIKSLYLNEFSDGVYKTPRMKTKNALVKKYKNISLLNETYDL